jgi:hypothetical protein
MRNRILKRREFDDDRLVGILLRRQIIAVACILNDQSLSFHTYNILKSG